MDIKEFQDKVEKALKEYGGAGREVKVTKVRKNNGIVRTGVSMQEKDSVITPTLYIDDYLRLYNKGVPFGQIMKEIIRVLEEHQTNTGFDIENFLKWEEAKEHIAYRLINASRNAELLKEVPSVPFMDMAIVFFYLMEGEAFGNASILVYHKHLECWGIDEDELFEQARINTVELLPPEIQDMEQLMRDVLIRSLRDKAADNDRLYDEGCMEAMADELMGQLVGRKRDVPMYVMTNNIRYYGAACMLYAGVIREFAQKEGHNMYILPSSVHEVILLPDRGYDDLPELKKMVCEVNDTQLSPEEVLSDSIYYYDREAEEISILSYADADAIA